MHYDKKYITNVYKCFNVYEICWIVSRWVPAYV